MLKFGKYTVESDDAEMYVRYVKSGVTARMLSIPAEYAPEDFVEVSKAEYDAELAAEKAELEYKREIVRLVRERYDADDEMAILRQRDAKPEEFAAYNAFVEDCKLKAKLTIMRV
ncbi:MAG: hypothetical protein HDS66_01505 [Bacteroidales bacterium]|nr:hypothetical protein [Bacteroidales bacterium]